MSAEEKLREIIREKIGLLSKVDEGRLQDQLEGLIRDLDTNGYSRFCDDYGIDLDDANEMMQFITDIPDKDAKRIIKDFEKGMYESKVEEYYKAPKSLDKRNDVLYS